MHPGGRPTKYAESMNEQAYRLCLLSATEQEIADFFDVDIATLTRWKEAHPEFRASIVRGREYADAHVADRLYNRAMGYSHPAVKIFMPAGASEPVYAPYTEHYPPDTAAASLWLRNRQPKKWRERTETVHEIGDNLAAAISDGRKRMLDITPDNGSEALPHIEADKPEDG